MEEDSVAESDDEEEKSLQQVNIKMLQVDWLTEDRNVGRRFLEILCSSEDCLRLFETNTIIYMTDYLWEQTFSFFVMRYFLPFMVLGFLPLLFMSFLMPIIDNSLSADEEEESTHTVFHVVYLICVILFNLLTFVHIWTEIQEMRQFTMKKYLRCASNYYQWAMILVNASLTYEIWYNYFGGAD